MLRFMYKILEMDQEQLAVKSKQLAQRPNITTFKQYNEKTKIRRFKQS
jgi:hypothetical protein